MSRAGKAPAQPSFSRVLLGFLWKSNYHEQSRNQISEYLPQRRKGRPRRRAWRSRALARGNPFM